MMRLLAVLVVSLVAYVLFSLVGFELSILQALICGVCFVSVDFLATRMHTRYLDKIGA